MSGEDAGGRTGLDPRRAVQVVTACAPRGGRRGSGYEVSRDTVLTAAHVLRDAVSVRVRFVAGDGRTREVPAEVVWSDAAADIAVLGLVREGADGADVAPQAAPAPVTPVTPVTHGSGGSTASSRAKPSASRTSNCAPTSPPAPRGTRSGSGTRTTPAAPSRPCPA